MHISTANRYVLALALALCLSFFCLNACAGFLHAKDEKVSVAWTTNLSTRFFYKYVPFSFQQKSACVNAGVIAATDDDFRLLDPLTGKMRAKLGLPYELENWTAAGDFIVYARRDWERDRSVFGAIAVNDMSRPLWQTEFDGMG